jgi:hypothetical protein
MIKNIWKVQALRRLGYFLAGGLAVFPIMEVAAAFDTSSIQPNTPISAAVIKGNFDDLKNNAKVVAKSMGLVACSVPAQGQAYCFGEDCPAGSVLASGGCLGDFGKDTFVKVAARDGNGGDRRWTCLFANQSNTPALVHAISTCLVHAPVPAGW